MSPMLGYNRPPPPSAPPKRPPIVWGEPHGGVPTSSDPHQSRSWRAPTAPWDPPLHWCSIPGGRASAAGSQRPPSCIWRRAAAPHARVKQRMDRGPGASGSITQVLMRWARLDAGAGRARALRQPRWGSSLRRDVGHPRSQLQAALPEVGPSHNSGTGRKFGTCGGKWFSPAGTRINFFFFWRRSN